MSNPVWGLLEKAQDDDQTILEAIDAKIAAHEADEEAHLGVGESLQSHRAEEIIDHVAGSIVQDKILNGEINLAKKSWSEFEFCTVFESLDAWLKSPSGITQSVGGVLLDTGATISTKRYLTAESLGDTSALDYSHTMFFQTAFKLGQITDQTLYIVVGSCELDDSDNGFGFKIVNGTLYAFHVMWNEGEKYETTTEITGITLTNFNIYRAEYDPNVVRIKFYVNGILKATHSDDIDSGVNPQFSTFYIINDAAASKKLYIKYLFFAKNLAD